MKKTSDLNEIHNKNYKEKKNIINNGNICICCGNKYPIGSHTVSKKFLKQICDDHGNVYAFIDFKDRLDKGAETLKKI